MIFSSTRSGASGLRACQASSVDSAIAFWKPKASRKFRAQQVATKKGNEGQCSPAIQYNSSMFSSYIYWFVAQYKTFGMFAGVQSLDSCPNLKGFMSWKFIVIHIKLPGMCTPTQQSRGRHRYSCLVAGSDMLGLAKSFFTFHALPGLKTIL